MSWMLSSQPLINKLTDRIFWKISEIPANYVSLAKYKDSWLEADAMSTTCEQSFLCLYGKAWDTWFFTSYGLVWSTTSGLVSMIHLIVGLFLFGLGMKWRGYSGGPPCFWFPPSFSWLRAKLSVTDLFYCPRFSTLVTNACTRSNNSSDGRTLNGGAEIIRCLDQPRNNSQRF